MLKSLLSLDDIIQMTVLGGEGWAVAHARRLLELIKVIGHDRPYDSHALTIAVYLHDWGAFPKYFQSGRDHALISRQVAEAEILPTVDLPDQVKTIILDAIELHDYRDNRPVKTNEALLLREADFLDFLGMIGIAREFARGGKDLQKSYQQTLVRKEQIKERFTIPQARQLAEQRLARMEQSLQWLAEESFGFL